MLKENLIFNPTGNDNVSDRTIIKGNTTGLYNLNDVKYKWAVSLYKVMMEAMWMPEKVKGLGEDAIQFKKELNEDEKRAYKGILSFLIFLDSIQTVNLPNFSDYITAPEVNLILGVQAFFEGLHSKSYATILETVVDSNDREEIYYFWRDDKILLERNEFIGGIYQDFKNNPNEENFFKGLVANFLLESVYFYNGFAFFDTLAINGKMLGTDRMIAYIKKDELCLHPSTEILTSEGWKLVGDVSLFDKVAQLDLTTEELTFDTPLHKTWREYKGNMYKISKKGRDIQNITEGHEVVVRTKSGKLSKEKIEDSRFNSYKEYVQGGIYKGNDTLSFLDRLNIAIQADGSIDKERTGKISGFQVVTFGLTKQRKKDRLEWILSNLEGIEYKKTETIRAGHWKYYVKIPHKYSVYKYFEFIKLDDISTKYAIDFLDELKNWDGHIIKNGGGGIVYVTNQDNVKDTIQSILVLSGFRNTTTFSKKEGYKDCYKIVYWPNKKGVHTQNLYKNKYYYEGMVGCVTMPKGTIVTRYGNFVTVQGNCHVSLFANIIKEIKKEFPEIYNEELLVDMMKIAVEQEIKWSKHILNNKIIGMGDSNIENYTKWLADTRLEMLGIKRIYNISKNPYSHLELMNDDNAGKGNFFESTVTNYSMSTSMNGSWEDL